jgi:NodT family efflux transporter outer membrane factor (OMF) lipoprotein
VILDRRLLAVGAACAVGLTLAGCTQAPPLRLPTLAVPQSYREAAPWVRAQSADELPRPDWWTLYGDPELDALQQRLIQGSPDLAAALARFQQARAAVGQVRAAQVPSVGLSLNTQRLEQSDRRPLRVLGPNSPDRYGSTTLGVDIGYEFDLWGRVESQVAVGVASEQAAGADLAAARLVLQAQLADSLLLLRGLDREAVLLRETDAALNKALDTVKRRHAGGVASGLDLARPQAQLASTRSQARQSAAQRAIVEHLIASLVGEPASTFTIAPSAPELVLPDVPTGVPSMLLQRRPDISAAELRVAAANASVGVARAAFFPAVTLGAALGLQSADAGRFLQASNLFWALGPTLVQSLFDGGRRRAEAERVEAALEEAAARYRGVVLTAFQQVEDQLALQREYAAAATSEAAAVAAARRSLELASARYREGASSYLEVVSSQTALLQAQRGALDLTTRQRRASVQLVRALGGGWTGRPAAPDR